jgi:CyaY protein
LHPAYNRHFYLDYDEEEVSMSDSDFERQGLALLAKIEQQLEHAMDDSGADWDSDLEGTVLRLTFDDDSKMVINLQAPLREVWLASRRGGFHFRFDPQHGWIDTRDGVVLGQRLVEELGHHAGVELKALAL